MALTPKQKAFADYYIELGNATEAARRAKYKGNDVTLAAVGSENLRKPQIAEYIAKAVRPEEEKRIASAEDVMQFFSDVMNGKVKDQFGLDASLSDRLKAGDALMKRYNAIKETESKNTFNEGMQALADLINNPAPNRNIADFEGDDDD